MLVPIFTIEPLTQCIVFPGNYSIFSNAFDGHLRATTLQLHNIAFAKLVFDHVAILFQCTANVGEKRSSLPHPAVWATNDTFRTGNHLLLPERLSAFVAIAANAPVPRL
jgi:hypothetical protein